MGFAVSELEDKTIVGGLRVDVGVRGQECINVIVKHGMAEPCQVGLFWHDLPN